MKLTIYQVDAFTDEVFKGNPAAVCPLNEWLEDELLLKIAAENNLSETAFYVPVADGYEIRWFTPNVEVDLCGHATLATAFVLFTQEGFKGDTIRFNSPRSGLLTVRIENGQFLLNFPKDEFQAIELSEQLINTSDKTPIAAFKGKTDYMLIFETEEEISSMKPALANIAALNARGLIVTAKGNDTDFVSRFFGPAVGVNEDPVCGSAHTTLMPYWAEKLNANKLKASQLSARTGKLSCELKGNRVELGGKAVLYLKGEIYL